MKATHVALFCILFLATIRGSAQEVVGFLEGGSGDGGRPGCHTCWHMDPHAAEFHMIDWNRDVDFQAFDVSFDQDVVRMEPWKDRGMVYFYRRK